MKKLIVLFIKTLTISFVGLVVANVLAIVVKDIFNGFELFLVQLSNLPYLIYFIFALVFSVVFTLSIRGKRNP